MDWWYKSSRQAINTENIAVLQDAIRTVLREGKSLANVNLYDNSEFFFIKTNSRFALNHFLNQNGFEELDEDEEPTKGLSMHYGNA